MAFNPFTSRKDSTERALLNAKHRLQNATTDTQKRSARTNVQQLQKNLLQLKQNERNWNKKQK